MISQVKSGSGRLGEIEAYPICNFAFYYSETLNQIFLNGGSNERIYQKVYEVTLWHAIIYSRKGKGRKM